MAKIFNKANKDRALGLWANFQSSSRTTFYFGLFFLIWGIFLFAGKLGWTDVRFPFWGTLLVVGGIYFIERSHKR